MKYLKIKDNVDLKELEKFGYKRLGGTEQEHYHYGYYVKKIFRLLSDDIAIVISLKKEDKRIIFARYYNNFEENFETRIFNPELKEKYIKDLIKANMVEVVKGDETEIDLENTKPLAAIMTSETVIFSRNSWEKIKEFFSRIKKQNFRLEQTLNEIEEYIESIKEDPDADMYMKLGDYKEFKHILQIIDKYKKEAD